MECDYSDTLNLGMLKWVTDTQSAAKFKTVFPAKYQPNFEGEITFCIKNISIANPDERCYDVSFINIDTFVIHWIEDGIAKGFSIDSVFSDLHIVLPDPILAERDIWDAYAE